MIVNKHQCGLGDVNQVTVGAGTSVGGALLTAGAIAGGPTNPVGLALLVAGGVTMLTSTLLGVFGVGKRNPIEDRDVKTLNALEVQLQQNLSAFNANPTTDNQTQALAIADQGLAQLVSLCSDPGLGTGWAEGCINDRKSGGKYDWVALYRTPIANTVPSDAGSLTSLVGSGNVVYVAGAVALIGIALAIKD